MYILPSKQTQIVSLEPYCWQTDAPEILYVALLIMKIRCQRYTNTRKHNDRCGFYGFCSRSSSPQVRNFSLFVVLSLSRTDGILRWLTCVFCIIQTTYITCRSRKWRRSKNNAGLIYKVIAKRKSVHRLIQIYNSTLRMLKEWTIHSALRNTHTLNTLRGIRKWWTTLSRMERTHPLHIPLEHSDVSVWMGAKTEQHQCMHGNKEKWHPQQYICERTCHGVVTSLAELLHVSPEWLWYHILGFIQHQSPTDFKLAATCDACTGYHVYSRWAMLSLIAAALWEVLPSGFTVWVRTNRRRCYEVCFEPFQSPQEYIPTANPQPLVTMTQNGTIIACQWLLTYSTQAYDMDLNVWMITEQFTSLPGCRLPSLLCTPLQETEPLGRAQVVTLTRCFCLLI